VASVGVTSTRACRLGGRQIVTPRRSDGRAAAAAVNLSGESNDYPVTVSPGHGASLSIVFAFDGCPIDMYTPANLIATAFSFDFDGAQGLFRLSRPVAACPMYANIESSDVYSKGDVELAVPADVKAGGRYDAHVDFQYLGTTAVILDPCPTIWARVSPESASELTMSWLLQCQGMRPVTYGDRLSVDLPVAIPAGIASQSVDIDVGFGLPSPPDRASSSQVSAPPTASERISVTGDHPLQPVPYMDIPAPPTPALQRTTSPPCDVSDLVPGNLDEPSNGAGGEVFISFTIVNATAHPCTLLSDTPVRLTAPHLPELTVPVSPGVIPVSVDGELAAGAATSVRTTVSSPPLRE